MGFQKCPVCNGAGRQFNTGLSTSIDRICDLCKGAMVISELTGEPPTIRCQSHRAKAVYFVDENDLKEFGLKRQDDDRPIS